MDTSEESGLIFNGSNYDPVLDDDRLSIQHVRIRDLMLDGQWRTLAAIEQATGDPPASISAQLRHLRKTRFGSYQVNKQKRGDRTQGLYEYRVTRRESLANGAGEAELFVRAWQKASSPQEVADCLNIALSSCLSRASRLRKRGVPLRCFSAGDHESRGNRKRKPRLDIPALAQLARELYGD